MPKSISGWFALSAAMAKLPEPCMPILPVSKIAWKFAPVSPCAPSGMMPSDHILCRCVSISLTPGPSSAASSPFLRQEMRARTPHARRLGEDVAAAAVAGEVVAVGVRPEGANLLGVFVDLVEGRRRLLRVEAGLLEEALVPEKDRHVRQEAGAVELAVIGGEILEGLGDLRLVGIVLEEVGQVDQEARLHEVGHEDQVERHEVGHVAGLNGGRELGHHLVVRDDGQLDLVLVLRVPEVDHALRRARRRRRATTWSASRRRQAAMSPPASRPREPVCL